MRKRNFNSIPICRNFWRQKLPPDNIHKQFGQNDEPVLDSKAFDTLIFLKRFLKNKSADDKKA